MVILSDNLKEYARNMKFTYFDFAKDFLEKAIDVSKVCLVLVPIVYSYLSVTSLALDCMKTVAWSYSEKCRKIRRKVPAMEAFFNNAAPLQLKLQLQLINGPSLQVFSCGYH